MRRARSSYDEASTDTEPDDALEGPRKRVRIFDSEIPPFSRGSFATVFGGVGSVARSVSGSDIVCSFEDLGGLSPICQSDESPLDEDLQHEVERLAVAAAEKQATGIARQRKLRREKEARNAFPPPPAGVGGAQSALLCRAWDSFSSQMTRSQMAQAEATSPFLLGSPAVATTAGRCWGPTGDPHDEQQHLSMSGWLYGWLGTAGASHADADTSTSLTSPPMISAHQQHPPLQLQQQQQLQHAPQQPQRQQLRMTMAADTAPAAAVAVDMLPSTTGVLVSSCTLSQSARDAAEGERLVVAPAPPIPAPIAGMDSLEAMAALIRDSEGIQKLGHALDNSF